MNERMEQEMEQTIQALKASLPQAKRRAPAMTLLRIAAEELSVPLLLGLLAGAVLLGVSCGRLLTAPLLAVFCTAPMPMLLLFHRYVCTDGRMRELEQTLPYSHAEMLLARSAVIGWYMLGALLLLSAALHAACGTGFLRLALCGAVPSLYLCTLLLLLAGVLRNPEGLALLAVAFWAALCFLITALPLRQLLALCTTGLYGVLAGIGLLLYGLCSKFLLERRGWYAANLG